MQNTSTNKEERLLPINTSYIRCSRSDQKCMDYKALALITYFSKMNDDMYYMYNPELDRYIQDMEIEERYRVIFKEFIDENIEKFEELSKTKRRTIRSQINRLIKADNSVVNVEFDDDGRVYYSIMPYLTNSDELSMQGTYVTIESAILKYLIHVSNSDVIKVYCIFKWLLLGHVEKKVDRHWLCEQIGLSTKSDNNIKLVGDILTFLVEDVELLRRRTVIEKSPTGAKTVYYYSLVPYKDWKRYRPMPEYFKRTRKY